jgi:hypothetical protein
MKLFEAVTKPAPERTDTMLRRVIPLFVIVCFMGLLFSCQRSPTTNTPVSSGAAINNVSNSAWLKLSEKRIYFGHKSVGQNIVEGVQDVLKQFPQIKLTVLESNNVEDFASPVFAHSAVGSNSDPDSKMKAFAEILDRGVGNRADIAFFKFCWLDVLPQTDVEKVFRDYESFMARIKEKYPQTTFIHVTVPLTSNQRGIQAWYKKGKDLIKKLIGRVNVYDNDKRNVLNEMLRQRYEGKEPFLDLAKIEATLPGEKQITAGKSETSDDDLIPLYTDDGGHLNELGRKIVAEHLLVLIAQLAK